MSKQKKLPEPEEVERLYWEEGMLQREIADKFGCHPDSVANYMVRHGIETMEERGCGREEIPEEDLLDDVIAGFVFTGVWPNTDFYKDFGEYTQWTFRQRFGSWPNAVEKAKERYEETKDDWPGPGVIDRE